LEAQGAGFLIFLWIVGRPPFCFCSPNGGSGADPLRACEPGGGRITWRMELVPGPSMRILAVIFLTGLALLAAGVFLGSWIALR